MLTLSAVAKAEKNKLAGDSTWPVLLEIRIREPAGAGDPGFILRLCTGADDLTWNSETWTAFPFELGDVKEAGRGEIPSVTVRVSNVTQEIQGYIEDAGGAIGKSVILRVVNSKNLAVATPEIQLDYVLEKVHYDAAHIAFTLSGSQKLNRRVPPDRYLKDFCPFQYGDLRCGVPAATIVTYPACNKSLAHCRERSNSSRFGGEPAIPLGGFYASTIK